jgi:hypothetical protein
VIEDTKVVLKEYYFDGVLYAFDAVGSFSGLGLV